MSKLRVLSVVLASGTAAIGCSSPESTTDLRPEGPPQVLQIIMEESFQPDGANFFATRDALGFGNHPSAGVYGVGANPVTSAEPRGNTFRVVVDELMVGNFLEEISCRSFVDNDSYSFVPVGTTPDDIERCAAAADVLENTCPGTGAYDTCIDTSGNPVGVLDENLDGAADDTRFIAGAATLTCGGTVIPLNLDSSFWQPSGTQIVPAAGTNPMRLIGPAINLEAATSLPTGRTCTLSFGEEVTDKQGERPCTPSSVQVAEDGTLIVGDCTGGDMSGFTFTVAPLRIVAITPADAATNVRPTNNTQEGSFDFRVNFNADVDAASVADFTWTPAPPMAPEVVIDPTTPNVLVLRVDGGLAVTTEYTVTIPTVTDLYGGPLADDISVTFTTRATP